jgi:hypothetical protein
MSDEYPGYFHFTSIWSLQKFGVSSTAFHNQSITMMPGPESSPEFAPPKPVSEAPSASINDPWQQPY